VRPSLTEQLRLRRRSALAIYACVLGATATLILISRAGEIAGAFRDQPAVWLMTAVAAVAGLLAYIDTPPSTRTPMLVSPTVGFSFAILLYAGLGPALVAQALASLFSAVRLRLPRCAAVEVAAHYMLALAAAAVVLKVGGHSLTPGQSPRNIAVHASIVGGAMLAWLLVFGVLNWISRSARRDGIPHRQLAVGVRNDLLFQAALLSLSPALAVAAGSNVAFVPLVFLPLYAVHRMARLSSDRDRMSRLDPLTKLANRIGLRDGFERMVQSYAVPRHDAPPPRATLLLLDLDRFKDVNDTLGHDVGDQLLITVAERVRALTPEGGTAARLGGDEFAILTLTRTAAEARTLATRLVTALAMPVRHERLRVDVAASVGIARHTDPTADFADLLRRADLAMYDAKSSGAAVAVAGEEAKQTTPERLSILTEFRDALEVGDREQVMLLYQPQVSLRTGEVEGVEALLRWRHPVHGPISTPELLSVVERTSIMQLLTMRVIDEVIADVAAWTRRGLMMRASLNISARDLYSEDIVSHLATQLERHRVAPSQIQIEITESALLADPTRAQSTVGRIAALGVSVALDDFGTGFSSLQHLRKLPIAEIKIDRTFVAGMADNHDDAAIVRSTVEMARSLGIRTVAEGVEDEYTFRRLVESGCTLAQGWHAAKPMPAGELAAWVVDRTARRQATPEIVHRT